MDDSQWQEIHQQSYGQDPWTRVELSAWVLTKRHLGYDPLDVDRIETKGTGTPEEHRERVAVWRPAARLVALALWRAARADGIRVDDVPLDRGLWWLGGACGGELFTAPLPPWTSLPGTWDRLERRTPELLERACWIISHQLLAHERELDQLSDSDDGTPVRLGDRIRAIEAGAFRDDAPPRWAGKVDYAQQAVAAAAHAVSGGHWRPGPAAQAAAAQLQPTLQAHPDTPPAPPEVAGYTWIQRVVRIAHIRTTVDAVVAHHRNRGEAELDSQEEHPLGWALAASSVALAGFDQSAADLEELWGRRTGGVADWEREHMPPPLRVYVVALEALAASLSTLTGYVLHPDEPH
ncbi:MULTISPECIES: hypothetical protein [Streptomyces]|uniref:hypothetical protein n=1 Tax=Streptomyces TaxID=1883 RepID=UPI00345BAFF2